MAVYYDFDRYSREYPRPGDDPGLLDVARTARNLLDLRAELEDGNSPNFVPPKTSHERLLLATWNIQSFGASQRWDESFYYIAEVISRFDIVAVQEVKQSLAELERVRELLGPWWKFVVTDVTEGNPGNDERLAYLFDIRKVRFGGMAGELVLPPVTDDNGVSAPIQIARTPFVVGFKTAHFQFMLATVHLLWGAAQADHPARVREAREIADFLLDRRGQTGVWSRNIILLGDFNIFDEDGAAAEALTDAGFELPHGREDLRATNVGHDARFYDQIAYIFENPDALAPRRVGVVDFFDAVYTGAKFPDYEPTMVTASGNIPANPNSYYRHTFRRRQMSDHLVLWVELPVDFSGEYLRARLG